MQQENKWHPTLAVPGALVAYTIGEYQNTRVRTGTIDRLTKTLATTKRDARIRLVDGIVLQGSTGFKAWMPTEDDVASYEAENERRALVAVLNKVEWHRLRLDDLRAAALAAHVVI